MIFEWDDDKNKSNLEKHGISFEEARGIFDSVVLTRIDNTANYDEIREISLGLLTTAIVLVVVHTDRDGVVRIISARKANRRERNLYYEHIEKTIERD